MMELIIVETMKSELPAGPFWQVAYGRRIALMGMTNIAV